MEHSSKNILYGLVTGLLLLALCIAIRPAGLAANDGISYFGGYINTAIPYSLAFLAIACSYWGATNKLHSKMLHRKFIIISLRFMAILLVGLVVTPHQIVNPIHTAIGSILFFYQLVLSIWLIAKVYFTWQTLVLVLIEFLSGVAAFYYLPLSHGLLLQAQIVFQLAFGVLLIIVFSKKNH